MSAFSASRRTAFILFVAFFLVLRSGSVADAAMWLDPAYPKEDLRGGAAAEGAFIWSHGFSGNPSDNEAVADPPLIASLMRKLGWDVFLFKRTFEQVSQPEPQAKELADLVTRLKWRGYRKIVLGGGSQGAWISIMAGANNADVYAVIANAPATYGSEQPGNSKNASVLFDHLNRIHDGRIMIAYFRDDPYDPGGRGPRSEEILSRNGVAHLVLDQPEGLGGHLAGQSGSFYRRFSPCIIALVGDGPIPQRKACESHWGESPSGEVPLPRNLTITPGGNGPEARFLGEWWGTYSVGREVMLVVTRVEDSWADAVYSIGPMPDVEEEQQDKGDYALRAGTVNGDTLEFVGKGNVTLRYRFNPDGSLKAEWTDINGDSLATVLHRLRSR